MRATLLAFLAGLSISFGTIAVLAAAPQSTLAPQGVHYDWVNG